MLLNAAYLKLLLFQNNVYYLSDGKYVLSAWLVQGAAYTGF